MESVASKAATERERYLGQIEELLMAATNQELRLYVQYMQRLQRVRY